jgi:hypothetical protein
MPEAAIVSTCNRTEIYCAGEQSELEPTLGWANTGGISPDALRSHTQLARWLWPPATPSCGQRTDSWCWASRKFWAS